MRCLKWLTGIFLFLSLEASGQQRLLNRPERQDMVQKCLHATYNYNFSEARALQQDLYKTDPLHPAYTFLEVLIIYWENFPLLPSDDEAQMFIEKIEKTIELADKMIEKNPEELEGLFFDLFGRAFRAMFWSDNGHPAKVLADLDNMYRVTVKGFDLTDKFNEFYFSTGLYNYYIEAFPKAHPIYKPFAALLKSGDTELGLKQLQYAIDHTVYLHVESLLFMTLLQLNYEKEYNTALNYASELYRSYPNNVYYMTVYSILLLRTGNYALADVIADKLEKTEETFSVMISELIFGYTDEKENNNLYQAGKLYENVIRKAKDFGHFADQYAAIAWMGQARIAAKEGNRQEAEKCYKKAESLTNYDFILADGWPLSR